MHLLLDIRSCVPPLEEILDYSEIFHFAPFKPFAVMKHELLIGLAKYFFVDIGNACKEVRLDCFRHAECGVNQGRFTGSRLGNH